MTDRIIILHTNDIHGRIEGLARVATLVEEITDNNPDAAVIYVDAGDVEETSVRLSNITKGSAMYSLLGAAGCQAGAVGNGSILRYGYQSLAEHSAAAGFPILMANYRLPDGNPPPGIVTRHVIHAGDTAIGFIGVTAEFEAYRSFFNLHPESARHVVRDLAASLWQDGVDIVILLSHLGLEEDMQLASKLQDIVNIIVGAHSHDLLPEGKQIGNVMIVQAGEYAQHLGRVDLRWTEDERLVIERVSVIPVEESVVQSAAVLQKLDEVEKRVEAFLQDTVAVLAQPFDYAIDRECAMGNLMADAVRHRFQAEVGLCVVGQAFNAGLPEGEIQRLSLYEICDSSANAGVVSLTGEQLYAMIRKGTDVEFAADTSVRGLRGRARGLMHLSGASILDEQLYVGDEPVNFDRTYRVGASDFEFVSNFGYAGDWALEPTYVAPEILRETLEIYLQSQPMPLHMEANRTDGPLA